MAIQMRRGRKDDFDPSKLLPGEWAVAVDTETKNQIIWMCFAAGMVKRMGTYEDFRQQIEEITEEIKAEYVEEFNALLERAEQAAALSEDCKEVVVQIYSDVVSSYLPQMLDCKEAAAESATASESWAHGGTNTRPNEETDNARAYAKIAEEYSNNWKGSLLPKGTISFSQLPTSGNVAGHLYNISQAFETDSRFEEGAGYSYPSGTNVYWNSNSRWDCLSGTLTKVLTQAAYDSMTESQKNNGTIYYITDSDNELSNATDAVPGVVIVDSSLSATSKNPVQNKVITERINGVSRDVESAENRQKSYTDTKIADLINGAPSTLDTLGEIADAMENNQTVIEALNSAIGTKVDKASGKGLSTNDYTTAEKNKLSGISAGAEANVQSDWNTSDTSSDAFIKNKPSIPSVGNGTVTIRQAGTSKGTFTMNQSGNATIELTDNNTWRGIQNSLTSDSTTDSLSAAQGKALANGSARDSTKLPTAGGTISGALTVTGDATLQGNVRIKKASSNYGSVINIGDGDYIRISEETDDMLTVKAKQININSTNANAVYINGQLALRFKKLTQAEYNALPSTKNSDNVLYFITG